MHARVGAAFRRVLLSAALLAAGVRAAHGGHYAWTTSGPEGGHIYQVVINPSDSNRVSAISGFMGPLVFQSSDQGQSWMQVASLGFTGRLVPHPTDGNILYTASTYGAASGVLKSPDGGTTWDAAGTGLPTMTFPMLAISPSSPQTLFAFFAGSPGLVYRSEDGAVSWDQMSAQFPAPNLADVAVDPQSPNVIYAATTAGVVKSVDAGASWQSTGLGISTARLLIDPSNSQRVFAGTDGSGVYASPDGGGTWQPANVGIETGYVRALVRHPALPDTLWVGLSSTGVGGGFFTTSNAHDWTPVDLGETVTVGSAFAIDSSDSNVMYAGGDFSALHGAVFQSLDGGATWTRSDKGLSGMLTFSVVAHPTDAAKAYTQVIGHFYDTPDSGASWNLKDDTGFALICLAIDPLTPATLYAGYSVPGTGLDGTLKSVDGGASWNPASNGLAVPILHRLGVSPSSPDHVLAGTDVGLFETVDGGGLWNPVYSTSNGVRAFGFDPMDSSILYAGPGVNGLLRSPDGGATWASPSGLPAAFTVTDVNALANDPQRVYLSTYLGIYRSDDRGLSFTPANTGLPPVASTVPYRLAGDPSTVGTEYMLAMTGGGAATDAPDQAAPHNVFRTTDAADSWIPLPGSIPTLNPYELAVGSDGRTIYCATVGGAFQFERSFLDVPDDDIFWVSIDAAAMNGVTAGCGGGKFCPDDPTLRSSIAVFLLRAKNGADYVPPPATGTIFDDVPAYLSAAPYIEELFDEGVTVGCGGASYCPDQPVTRAEISVLLLKMEHGSDYEPPPATGTMFDDVPADAFAAAWIEQLAREGVTAGCGGGNFCPDDPVTRAQAAAFVVLLFGLS
ncbi:MAG TPA: S-layer homology domain-containing protein [Thermoanaerobaculia bacterium]|jgi:photosystem II stability/assembly factor-like uncharacterized protein